MAKKALRKTNSTVLIVVEGYTEEAFLTHLKALYYQRGTRLSVQIKNAQGYGPKGIITKLLAVTKTAEFEHFVVVFDGDIPLSPADEKMLKSLNADKVISIPAIEATLLRILNKPAPDTTAACKTKLQQYAPGNSVEVSYFNKHFPFALLEERRNEVPQLAQLIAWLSSPQ